MAESARRQPVATVGDVARLGPTHVDTRRRLVPVSYLARPGDFGHHPRPELVLPPGGDTVSQRIAVLQHQLVLAWNNNGRRPSAADLARTWGVSKQTLSRCTLGERWFGETLLATFIHAAAARPMPDTPRMRRFAGPERSGSRNRPQPRPKGPDR